MLKLLAMRMIKDCSLFGNKLFNSLVQNSENSVLSYIKYFMVEEDQDMIQKNKTLKSLQVLMVESVSAWAQIFKKDPLSPGKESKFAQLYRELMEEGVMKPVTNYQYFR